MRHTDNGRAGPGHRRHIAARSAAAAAAAFLLLGNLCAQRAKPTEYQLKATYLYNFTQFVLWPRQAPPDPNRPFSICILGRDPFRSALDAVLSGARVYGRSVVAVRIAAPREAAACRILFISASEQERLGQILEAIGKFEVLTVSDMPYFTQRGGMIEFTSDGNRIRFAVNLSRAREAGLILSSELLKLALSVRQSPLPGN
jgi:hypothetical protein